MKKDVIFVLKAVAGVCAAFLIGGMFDFFPFFFLSDIIAKEIAFCTLLICTVMAICTRMILNAVQKSKEPADEQENSEESDPPSPTE